MIMEDRRLWDTLLGVDFQLLEYDGYQRQVRGEDTVILAHLHCLPSLFPLIWILQREDLSIPAKQIIVIAKPYSTIPSTLRDLRGLGITILSPETNFQLGQYDQAVSKHLSEGCERAKAVCNDVRKRGRKPRLILVDDGGMLTETWWAHYTDEKIEAVSVQQTASGIRRDPRPSEIAKIDVARSAAKKYFESKIIAAGVLKKVRELDVFARASSIGIAGVGAVGGALAFDLASRGTVPHLYDVRENYKAPAEARKVFRIGEFLNKCDVVFGCTGRNFLKPEFLRRIRRDHKITFVSCSSRDTEFQYLLQLGKLKSAPSDQFGRLEISFDGGRCHTVENSGFPINFDRIEEQEGTDEIILTRALVLTGIFQAVCVNVNKPRNDLLRLSPSIQKRLVEQWLAMTGQCAENFHLRKTDIKALKWWTENSYGDSPGQEKKLETIAPLLPLEIDNRRRVLLQRRPAKAASV